MAAGQRKTREGKRRSRRQSKMDAEGERGEASRKNRSTTDTPRRIHLKGEERQADGRAARQETPFLPLLLQTRQRHRNTTACHSQGETQRPVNRPIPLGKSGGGGGREGEAGEGEGEGREGGGEEEELRGVEKKKGGGWRRRRRREGGEYDEGPKTGKSKMK